MTDCCAAIRWFLGDSRTYRFTVLEKGATTPTPIDITGWPIAAEIWDAGSGDVKKATANMVGGADIQIKVIDGVAGIFEVYILKDETTGFNLDANFEVAEYSDGGKNTIYRAAVKFSTPKVDRVVI